MSIDVRITGVDELLRKVDRASKNVPEAARRGCLRGAVVIEGAAKGHAPVKTGMLRNSIKSEPIPLGAQVGPHVEYAAYQEYGTMYMPAQPYMRPAVEEKRKEVQRVVGEAIRNELGDR